MYTKFIATLALTSSVAFAMQRQVQCTSTSNPNAPTKNFILNDEGIRKSIYETNQNWQPSRDQNGEIIGVHGCNVSFHNADSFFCGQEDSAFIFTHFEGEPITLETTVWVGGCFGGKPIKYTTTYHCKYLPRRCGN